MEGISGSSNSGSFSLHKKRKVEPRINSFGCCRSCMAIHFQYSNTIYTSHILFTLRYASQTKIISWRSLPSPLVLGHISQKMSSSFLISWSLQGRTNRIMVISKPGKRSPFKTSWITFFRATAFPRLSQCSKHRSRHLETHKGYVAQAT